MKSLWIAIISALSPVMAAGAVVDDNFEDGVIGSQWTQLIDHSDALTVSEQNGHLNLVSAGGGLSTNDADYLSTFRVSALSDFSISIDYFLTPVNSYTGSSTSESGDKLGLVFGVGRDLDGTDSAAIGVGYGNVIGFISDASSVAYRIDDAQTTGATELFSPTTGTFEIDYVAGADPMSDVLTLKRSVPGAPTFAYSLPAGTVRNTWGATDLLISFGGRGSGFSSNVGQMYVDNFKLLSGTIVPEPACLTVFSGIGLLARRRRR